MATSDEMEEDDDQSSSAFVCVRPAVGSARFACFSTSARAGAPIISRSCTARAPASTALGSTCDGVLGSAPRRLFEQSADEHFTRFNDHPPKTSYAVGMIHADVQGVPEALCITPLDTAVQLRPTFAQIDLQAAESASASAAGAGVSGSGASSPSPKRRGVGRRVVFDDEDEEDGGGAYAGAGNGDGGDGAGGLGWRGGGGG